MAQTRTQTLHRTVVNRTRDHDYLYDPTYTLSSDQDHARDAYRAQTNPNRIVLCCDCLGDYIMLSPFHFEEQRIPTHNEMFSALPHFPRFQLRLNNTDPVPKFVSRRWRGYADQRREALIRYKTCNYDPAVAVPAVKYENPKVSGQNRYKYFRRPIIPFLQQVPPEVLLQPTTVDPLAPPGELMKRVPTPATRNIEIQTDYRDSEAQTDPYTPEYVVRPGSAPELLTLATLTYNHGLPAGLAEVEMIERARAKREWEKTLPPLSDVTQLEKRKRMMDEMETKEWLLREQEIEKLQEERLEVLKKLLIQREIKQQELNDKRLDKLWSKKQKIKEGKIMKIRKEHIRTVRRLIRKSKNVEGKFERKDFVKEYGEFGSQAHAPLTRVGVFLDRGSEQYVVRSRYLNTFQGLLELEASLPDFVTQPRVRAPQKPVMGAFGYVKKKYRLTKQLEDMHKAITEAKKKGAEPPKPLRFLHKVEKPVPRPPTPTTEVPSEVDFLQSGVSIFIQSDQSMDTVGWRELEKEELATIFLQKTIRGRAIQNMMYEGKEKRLELINEVRSTHALQKAEQQLKKTERQHVVSLQRQRRLYQHKESYVNEIVSQIEGESIADLLDFLSKELIRLQEERRIHAISMLAERRRRLREAEESGRRQVEERRRREEDEIFKQLMKIHQTTVDTYLEDIVMDAVDGTADEQARDEIRDFADKINDVAYAMEEKRTQLQSEEIVSELVHCFLLPEILKINSRQKIKLDQKKHILAAHRIIHATTAPVLGESVEDLSGTVGRDSGAFGRAESASGRAGSSADSRGEKNTDRIKISIEESRRGTDDDLSQAVTSPDVHHRHSYPPIPTQPIPTSPVGRKSTVISGSPPPSRELTRDGSRDADQRRGSASLRRYSSGGGSQGISAAAASVGSPDQDYLALRRDDEVAGDDDDSRKSPAHRSDLSIPTDFLPTSDVVRKSLPPGSHLTSPTGATPETVADETSEQEATKFPEFDIAKPDIRRTDPAIPTQFLQTSTVSSKSMPPKGTPLSDVTHVDVPPPPYAPSPIRRTVPDLPSQFLDTAAVGHKSDPGVQSDLHGSVTTDDVTHDAVEPSSPSRRSRPPVPTQFIDAEEVTRKSDPEVRVDLTQGSDQPVADQASVVQESETIDPSSIPPKGETVDSGSVPQESETADSGSVPQEGEIVDPSSVPQESGTADPSSVPQESETAGSGSVSQEGEIVDPSSVPQESGTADPSSVPQESETAGSGSVSQEGEIVAPSLVPQESEAVDSGSVPPEGEIVDPSSVPQESGTSDPSSVPQESETAGSGSVSQEGEIVAPSLVPQESETVDPSSVPQLDETVDPVSVPQEGETVDSSSVPQEGEPTDSVEVEKETGTQESPPNETAKTEEQQ